MLTAPPGLVRATAWLTSSGMPMQTMEASAPTPPVASMVARVRSSVVGSTAAVAPSRSAWARRPPLGSLTMTLSAPDSRAS